MELQGFVVFSLLIMMAMFCWNIYLSKRFQYITQINHSYHHIFNNSSEYLFIIKPDGILLEANQCALQYYGLIKEYILGKPLWEAFSQLISTSSQQQLHSAIAKVAGGKLVNLNLELLQKKDTVNCDFSLTPITDAKAKVTLIVVSACDRNQIFPRDYTLQEQLLKTFFNNACIGLAILDDQWRHLLINKILADINGKSIEEHIGKPVREIIPQLAPQLESIYQEVQATGEAVCRIEITGETPRKPGLIAQWEASYFPLPFSDSRTAIGCVVLEITERKKAETSLATRLEQQATVAQLGQLALSGIKLSALFKETTVMVAQSLNVDACKILELKRDTNALVLRSSVGLQEDLIDRATVEIDCKSQAGYALLSGETVILDNLYKETRFTGSALLHQHEYISGVSTIIQGRENQPFGILEAHSAKEHQFSQDDANFVQSVANILSTAITRKKAESENRKLNATLEARVKQRTLELEKANQELEAFCYSVSHDLRAPLRAIQGFAQVLMEDYESLFDDIGREYLNRLMAAAAHLDTLILDLLAYSRLGRTQIQLTQVSLATVIQGILNELESELQENQAQIIIKSTLPPVISQQSTLKSIITNLLTNAVKFVHADVNPVVQIWAEEHGEWVKLFIQDNGIGIAPQHQERIFRVFERLHGIESYPGTGIGLAIVQRGMESLGGKVGVDSTPNQGSCFWIEFPPASPAPS